MASETMLRTETTDVTDAANRSANGLPQGTFAVDANGQATYRIPITVPIGVANFQPQLALTYTHRQPNGILGVGWGLAGLSAITRTKATYAVDGFNGAITYGPNDRYTLDGQRLINVAGEYGQPGTVYYTELQTWNDVRAGTAPDSGFTVTTKSGEVWEYGQTADSRILAAGGTGVRVWALNARMDRNGNRIEYQYTQSPVAGGPDAGAESGAYYLSRISYTVRSDMAAQRFVDFAYETRPDRIVQFQGGYPVVTAYRLQQIATSLAGGDVVRSYTLAYQTSAATRLSCVTSITESGASAAGNPALPSTQALWQDVTQPGFVINPASHLDQHLNPVTIEAMDVRGSGRTDVVQLWLDTDNTIHATTYLATPGHDGITYVRAADSKLDAYPQTREIFPADVNGDGRTDLLIAFQSGVDQTIHLHVYLSNGTGFDFGGAFNTGDTWTTEHIRFFAVDANGDGRTDLVEAYGHYDPDQGDLLYFRSYLAKFGDGPGETFSEGIVSETDDPAIPNTLLAFWPLDVNGDGMMDIVRVWQDDNSEIIATAFIAVSTAIDAVTFADRVESNLGTFSLPNQLAFLPVDVDGDGFQDLLQVWQEPTRGGTTLHLTTFLANAAGGFVQGPDSAFPDRTIDPHGFYPMGFTGGGPTSLISKWISGNDDLMFTAFTPSPSGEFALAAEFDAGKAGSAVVNAGFFAGDANGDGKADLIRIATGQNQEPVLVPYTASGPYPDLVTTITNPLGGVVAIDYLPLTDDTVYAPSQAPDFPRSVGLRYPNPLTPAQFPVQMVTGSAIYVVSGYVQRNDPARNRFAYNTATTMSYTGAAVNLLGRGWEGFETVTSLDSESGKQTIQTFNQDFPLSGTVAATRIEADGRSAADPRVSASDTGLLMRLESATYEAVPRATGVNPGQHVVEVLRTANRVEAYDYGADRYDYALGQTFAYDDYGNQTLRVSLGYIDRATGRPLYPEEVVYHYSSYQNDRFADGWALGYLRYDKSSANATDPDITRFLPGDYQLAQHTYAPSTYTLASSATWDDVHQVWLTTQYAYNSDGNRTSETAPGGFVTHYDYDPDYRTFPMQKTTPNNAQGEPLVIMYGYDPRFGTEVARIDPNAQVFVTALDPFGRKAAQQGPVPDMPGAQHDANLVTPLVTGTPTLRQTFQNATVVTLETTAYLDDGQGGLASQVRALQQFPTDAARDFLWTQSYVDGRGNTREAVRQTGQSAGNAVMLADFNGSGNPVRQSLPFFSPTAIDPPASHWTTRTYDVLGRPVRQEDPAGPDGNGVSVATWIYGMGGVVTTTAAAGSDAAYEQVLTHHFYDGQDKVIRSSLPTDGNATTEFAFDPIGRLLTATDPATPANPQGVSNTITYDAMDRRLTLDNPDQNTTINRDIVAMTFAYDATTGLLQRQTDAAGLATIYTYDNLGRVLTKALGDGRTIANVYDGTVNGRGYPETVTVRAADQSVESQYAYAYDKYGNISSTTLTISGEADPFVTLATFDPQKRLVSQTSPDGTVLTRTYSGGELVAQTLGAARVDYPLEQFTPQGKAGQLIYGQGSLPGPGIVTEYTYSPAGLRYHEVVQNDAGTVLQLTSQFDLLDQLLEIADEIDPTQTQSFTYGNKRLLTAVTPGFDPGSYTYDASGNLTRKDGMEYTYRAHFPVSMKAGGEEVYAATQDACGRTQRRTVNGATLTFAYDGLGCLRKVTSAAGETVRDILSDFEGRRVRETQADGTIVLYISPTYQVTRPAAGAASVTQSVLDTGGVAASVTTGAGADIRYFRRDHKGSVTLTFGADGAVVSRIAYSGYGEFRITSGPDDFLPKYEQRQWDDGTDLYYFSARFYDPMTGRFLTPDTELGSQNILRADALNRFAFELNNPVNLVDPTGHTPEWVGGFIAGLFIVAIAALIIVSGGAATPLAAIGVGALLGAGLNASIYSITHQDTHGGAFIGGLVVNMLVGAAIGAATAGVAAGLSLAAETATNALVSAGESAVEGSLTARIGTFAVTRLGQGLIRGSIYAVGGSAWTAGSDTFNQFMSNVVDKYIIKDKDASLGAGLERAAITGAIAGFIGGGLEGGVEGRFARFNRGANLGDVELQPRNEASRLLASQTTPAVEFESKLWVVNSLKARAILFGISEGSTVVDASLEAAGL